MSGKASPASLGDRDGGLSSENELAVDERAVESLVTGRKKRATAGNRLSSLLENEGDDELQLLFAENEEEEDVEFEEEDEEASDVEFGSSSDEEDQGASKGDDDLTGEKELQKQDRLERQKKRKAHNVFKKPGALRKKVKIDPSTAPITPAPRAKKKSERVSWLHTEADAPTRLSSRKQTVKNREVIHQRLVDSEHSRLKIMQQMEEAQKRKAAMRPKTLTQADRLEEAAKTEWKNAKSLNRWEESEKKRAEEQRAKLEALHSRQLTGPVITWWSGLARWVNGKIDQLGIKEIRAQGHVEIPIIKAAEFINSVQEELIQRPLRGDDNHDNAMAGVLHPHHLTESSGHLAFSDSHQSSAKQHYTFAPPQGPYGFLDGIHAYAALPAQQQAAEFSGTAENNSSPQAFVAPNTPQILDRGSLIVASESSKKQAPTEEYSSRNLVALKNIDANVVKVPELQSNVLVKDKRKNTKVQSKSSSMIAAAHPDLTRHAEAATEICTITMQPARFRDPKTGLAYANSYAYKEIQRLWEGGSRWSNLLGCYVGPTNSPAAGVPERFWKRP